MEGMIKAVLFDLDGTLYDRDEHILRMAHGQFDQFRSELAGVDRHRFVSRSVELDSHGYGDHRDMYSLLARDFGLSEGFAEELESHFRTSYHANLILDDDTLMTLQTLRERGKRLGVITNGPSDWQSRKLDSLGIRHYFDTIVISGDEGVNKPDPEIFSLALGRCRVLASEAIFVGDNPEADIQGALKSGLKPVWKRVPYWVVPPDITRVENLSEILALCEE